MDVRVALDRNENGSLKRTKLGQVRFELRLKEGDSLVVGIEGCRLDEEHDRVLLPQAGRFSNLNILFVKEELLHEAKERVKAAIKKEAEEAFSPGPLG